MRHGQAHPAPARDSGGVACPLTRSTLYNDRANQARKYAKQTATKQGQETGWGQTGQEETLKENRSKRIRWKEAGWDLHLWHARSSKGLNLYPQLMVRMMLLNLQQLAGCHLAFIKQQRALGSFLQHNDYLCSHP